MIVVDSWIVKAFIFCFRDKTNSSLSKSVSLCGCPLLLCASSVAPPISDQSKSGR